MHKRVKGAFTIIQSEFEAMECEIQDWVSYSEEISKAHGFNYNGDPEDPGPDCNSFDIFCVRQLRKDREELVRIMKRLYEEYKDEPIHRPPTKLWNLIAIWATTRV